VNTGNYIVIAILHTFQFTTEHALGFSVFTSRIPATDLPQSHCNYKSHVRSSCHGLIPFLLFPQPPISKTPPSSLPTAVLYSMLLCFYYSCPAEHFLQPLCTDPNENMFPAPLTSNRRPTIPRVCFCGNVFIEPLPSNGYIRPSIINKRKRPFFPHCFNDIKYIGIMKIKTEATGGYYLL
jgi:hypothetical protein